MYNNVTYDIMRGNGRQSIPLKRVQTTLDFHHIVFGQQFC